MHGKSCRERRPDLHQHGNSTGFGRSKAFARFALLRRVSCFAGQMHAQILSAGCSDDPGLRHGRVHQRFLLRAILDGHVKIMTARRDVEKLIDDPATSEALRARMTSARAIRQFAVDELALPDNKSYRSYVDVGQDAVTMGGIRCAGTLADTPNMVFSGLRLRSVQGIFSQKVGAEFAAELQSQGLDVDVTGIAAYSDAGWSVTRC